MNTTRLLAKFKRKKLRFKHWFLPAAILTATLLLTYTLLTLLSDPRPPRLKSGRGDTLYSASNKVFSAGIGRKDGTPEISFTRGNSGLRFVLAGSKKVKPVKTSSTVVTFPSVQPGIDLVYTTLASGLKEELVIDSRASLTSNVFLFDLTLNNAISSTMTTGFLDSTFRNSDGDYLFHFEKPFALDASGNRTDDVLLQIMEDKQLPGKYSMKLIVDENWLKDPSRVYPITIDPTVVHDTTAEFATGTFNRVFDVGSGSSPRLESYYQELAADEFTIGLWHMNEGSANTCTGGTNDVCDSTINGLDGAFSGNTTFTTDSKLGNSATIYDGTSGQVTIADDPKLSFTDKKFTIEMWVKRNGNPAAIEYLVLKGVAVWEYTVRILTTGLVQTVIWGSGSGTSIGTVSSTKTITDGEWHHIAMVVDGTYSYIYIDGVLDNYGAVVGTLSNTTASLYFGDRSDVVNSEFEGSLDEIRISNINRSPSEIKASAARRPSSVYTSEVLDLGGASSFVTAWNSFSWTELGVTTGDGETLADSTSLVAQWNFNETSGTTATNNAGTCSTSCDGTLTGFDSTASQDADPDSGWTANHKRFGAGALMFDNIDTYVTIPDDNSLSFGSGGTDSPFSLSTWINPKTIATATGDWLINKRNADASDEYQLTIGTDGSIAFIVMSGNSNYIGRRSAPLITVGQWHLITATYDGSKTNAGIKIYINGRRADVSDNNTGTYTGMSNGAHPVTIGKPGWSNALYFDGVMDSTAIFARELTAAEIMSNYQAGQIELQTRVGSTTTPDDGSWEAWAPISGETQINNLDTADDSLVSYWPFEEYNVATTHDRISSNHGTVTGATQMISRHTRAYNFTDGNDYITVSDHASLDITGDFTLMAWVYRTGGSNGYIISKFDTTGGGGYSLLHGNSGEVYCRTDNGSSYTDSYTTTGHVTTSTGWTHVTAVRSGSSCQVYINGTNQTSVSGTHTTVTANAQPFKIGANASDNSSPFYGYMDEVRVFNDALSQAEILHYMGSSTAYDQLKNSRDTVIKMEGNASLKLETGALKVDPNTVALWKFDETGGSGAFIKDSSTNALHITPTGTTSTKGITQRGRDFNGTSDYMYTPTTMTIPTGDFTYEAWIRPDTVNDEMLFMASDGTGANEFFVLLTSTDKVQVVTNGVARLTTTTAIAAGQWQHLVVTRSGSTITAYINGIADATTGTDGVAMAFGACGLLIGTDADTGCDGALGNWFDGIIDEVRVSNIAKNAIEINEIYRAGRDQYFNSHMTSIDLSDKTNIPFYVAADRPGTYLQASLGETPFSLGQPDGNTVGLWRLDEKSGTSSYIRDSAGSALYGIPTGTTHVEGKIGKARYFNNTSDYITLSGSASSFNINTYSYSAWVNPTVLGAANHFILDNRDAASDGSIMHINTTDNYNCQHNGINATDTTTVTLNKWTHIACVSDGSTIKIYIDGVLKASTAIATSISITTDAKIGTRSFSTPTAYFAGTIDELRFDKTARTADEIRSAYEYGMGLRSHPITIDFAADLDSGNLIADSNDLSFTVDATTYGLNAKGSMLFPGDKIIVNENYDGTQYQAQGTVTGVTSSTGAVTVASWDSGSTFPSGGYTAGASIFKWQREYWNHRGSVLNSHLDGITQLSLSLTDGAEGRTIYLDDLRNSSGYLTTPAGSTITSSVGERYFQYRAILSSSDEAVSPQLSMVTVDYDINVAPNIPSLDAPTDYTADTITFEEVANGTAENATITSVATTSLTGVADHLYLAAISTKNPQTPTSVTGLGLTWTLIDVQCGDRNQNNIMVYQAIGTPSGNGAVTAAFNSYSGGAAISVSRYSGVDPNDPIGNIENANTGGVGLSAGACDGTGTDSNSYSFSTLDTQLDGSVVYSAASQRGRTHTPGTAHSGYTERADIQSGASGETAGIATQDQTFATATSNLTVNGTFNGTTDWGVIAIEIKPQLTPTGTATNQSLTPTFQTTTTDADTDYLRYRIEVCENVGMTVGCQTYDQTSSQTGWSGQNAQTSTAYTSGTQATYTVQTPLSAGTTYYWRSSAIDPAGTNTWGSTQVTPYSFTTTTAPSAPTTPWTEGATNPTGIIDLTPEFSAIHNDSDGDPAVYYEIEVNTASDFTGTVMWDTNQTAMSSLADGARSSDVSYAGSALSWGTTYYWRIRFTDDLGAVGTWSATQNFTTNSYATSPTITSPLDGAIKVGLTPTITLSSTDPDSDYLRYRLQICEDLAMTTNCQSFDQTSSQTGWSGQDAETSTAYASGTTASYTLTSNLAPSTPYYLHAGAIDPAGTNTWTSYSSVLSFTTRALNEGFHCLIEETATDTSLTVTWTDRETNEDNYILERNVNGGGFSLYQTLAAGTTSYQDTSISQGNTYQYRIAPYTIAGDATGQWCTTNTLSLESGLFNFSGLNFSGLNLN